MHILSFHLHGGTLMTDGRDSGAPVVQSHPPHCTHIETRAQRGQAITQGTHRTESWFPYSEVLLFYHILFCEILIDHHSDSRTVTDT